MIDYKQSTLVRILKERIAAGAYQEYLPKAEILAAEFSVNVKTMNKAIGQLVQQQLVERKRHIGTRILRQENIARGDQAVEIIFEGFTSPFSHPYWGRIWEPLLNELLASNFRPVLTMLESDPETGLLNLDELQLFPATGRIVLGIGEKHLLDRIAATGIPCICGCDLLDQSPIAQAAFDFTSGIREAVEFLHSRNCRRIGFIGQTVNLTGSQQLNKFRAYSHAVQQFCQINPKLIAHVRPLENQGADAVEKLLAQKTPPDALISAFDHQLPEILRTLEKHGVCIPVIGCDGLKLPGVPSHRPAVAVPFDECGRLLAQKLIHAINIRRKPASTILPARFYSCF